MFIGFRIMRAILFVFFLTVISLLSSNAQTVKVSGYVLDRHSKDTLYFSNVYIKGTPYGTATNINGYFSLSFPASYDTITCFYTGYKPTQILVDTLTKKTNITIYLDLDTEVEAVIITPKENPAFRIIRTCNENRKYHSKEFIPQYEYQSYNQTGIYITNISDSLRKRKVMQEVGALLDSLPNNKDIHGKPMLPVLYSESVSSTYFRNKPKAKKEIVEGIKVRGVGMGDGSLLSQLLGSTFQDYNFYDNYIQVLNKDFASPIGDAWKLNYDFTLVDSGFYHGRYGYKILYEPKRVQDLCFTGELYIADSSFALYHLTASISRRANLNYIDSVYFVQTLQPYDSVGWLPSKTNILVDIQDLSSSTPSIAADYSCTLLDVRKGQVRTDAFYDPAIEVLENAQQQNVDYWSKNTPSDQDSVKQKSYALIDSLRDLPTVKTYIEIIDIAISGYKTVGKFEIGPYLFAYAYNYTERHRIQIGFKTNEHFSRKWVFRGHLAYGTGDQRFKYKLGARYIFTRKHWTEAEVYYWNDIDQVSAPAAALQDNYIFLAATRWLRLRGPFYKSQWNAEVFRYWHKFAQTTIGIRTIDFNPIYDFAFYESANNTNLQTRFQTTELFAGWRISFDEKILINGNNRLSLGDKKFPIIELKYIYGSKILNGNFEYHKVKFELDHSFRIGVLGRTTYKIEAGKTFQTLPYPLLQVHIGNETPFYTTAAYNLMNFFEFASDQYAGLRWQHDFEGLFFNRIPAIRRMKWRFFVTSNVLFGSLSTANQAILAPTTPDGRTTYQINSLNPNIPYAEVGYGIDNIFKLLRIDFVHRVTYLDNPDIHKFGVKASVHFSL